MQIIPATSAPTPAATAVVDRPEITAAARAFGMAASELQQVSRDEPSDLDGPLGVAAAHLLDGIELLLRAPDSTKPFEAQLQLAVRDASTAARLVAAADDAGIVDGTNPAAADALFDAAEQLALAAQRTLQQLQPSA